MVFFAKLLFVIMLKGIDMSTVVI